MNTKVEDLKDEIIRQRDSSEEMISKFNFVPEESKQYNYGLLDAYQYVLDWMEENGLA